MRDAILAFGDQLRTPAAVTSLLQVPWRRIITCGMGGSSVAGEMLSLVRDDVVVHWDYALPASAGIQDLAVCTSWSGDTKETLSAYDAARTAGIPVAAITCGGELARRAREDNVPLVMLDNPGIPPRIGAGLMIAALLRLVGSEGELPERIDAAALEDEGKRLAQEIGTKSPVFYAAYPWRKVAGFFKTTVNENAKRHSWAGSFPSAAHNEIVGWAGPYRDTMVPVLIRDGADGPYGKDFDALIAIAGTMGYTVPTIELRGTTSLQKALNAYVTALWTSMRMAQGLGVDPNDTAWIDEFKRLKA